MAEFILAYHGGTQPESKEAGAAQMARWRAWLEELGDAVINPGTPLGGSKWITAIEFILIHSSIISSSIIHHLNDQ